MPLPPSSPHIPRNHPRSQPTSSERDDDDGDDDDDDDDASCVVTLECHECSALAPPLDPSIARHTDTQTYRHIQRYTDIYRRWCDDGRSSHARWVVARRVCLCGVCVCVSACACASAAHHPPHHRRRRRRAVALEAMRLRAAARRKRDEATHAEAASLRKQLTEA